MYYLFTMKTTVTTKNMITVPVEISRRFAITPGCRLDWAPVAGSESELRVRIIPKRADLAQRLRGAGAGWAPERSAVAELVAERAKEG
jgi:bifunctional DNA-binding transcriptional regulator/antitoxin component of YhaV-PrlF toxin-antitoxin module